MCMHEIKRERRVASENDVPISPLAYPLVRITRERARLYRDNDDASRAALHSRDESAFMRV